MIVVTGAAGFIGSRLIKKLNEEKTEAVLAVDDFSNPLKKYNLEGLKILEKIDRNLFIPWLDKNHKQIQFLFHLGARTDTMEFNREILFRMNTHYSQEIWQKCSEYQIPLVYASTAVTYGNGEQGFDDDETVIPRLKPLNPFGESKNTFDLWALNQRNKPAFWAGLKFFSVFGPFENHKGRMASVVWHAYHQIKQSGTLRLFRSHRPDIRDGEQKRDFIFVNDVTEVCYFMMNNRNRSGIYNVGTGLSRSFLDLGISVFRSMNRKEKIEFTDTPEDMRENYQYFTEANIGKLRSAGYTKPFASLETGIEDYVKNYLGKLSE